MNALAQRARVVQQDPKLIENSTKRCRIGKLSNLVKSCVYKYKVRAFNMKILNVRTYWQANGIINLMGGMAEHDNKFKNEIQTLISETPNRQARRALFFLHCAEVCLSLGWPRGPGSGPVLPKSVPERKGGNGFENAKRLNHLVIQAQP